MTSQNQPIRILIVGAGAVGCFYGSRLHNLERNVLVSLICRSNYKTIVAAGGVEMQTTKYGDYMFKPEYVFPDVGSAVTPASAHRVNRFVDGEVGWDYLVITTKALPDVEDDSALIAPLVGAYPAAGIVLIQNGVGVEEPYRRRFGGDVPILSAVTVVSAEQVRSGVVRHNRWTRISVGPYTDGLGDADGEGSLGKQKTAEFVRLLKDGGIRDAEEYDEKSLQTVRWHKIAINAAMNPSAVLSYGTPNATMVRMPELREHLRGCMYEVFRGAEAVLGRPFPPENMELARPETILTSTERNEGGRPSMVGDWERGATMELEVILGNPIRLAKAKGVEMPRLQAMYALLKMAQTRRQEERRKAEGRSTAKL